MGQDIITSHFRQEDFTRFREKLHEEMVILDSWFRQGAFSSQGWVGGFELEAWLVDVLGRAAPQNQVFLERLNHPNVVPELAQFNIEVNGSPQPLQANGLQNMADELTQTWQQCTQMATQCQLQLAMIGILPSVERSQLTLETMSPRPRYYALNEQLMRFRHGQPTPFQIEGRQTLTLDQPDIMIESATTSFQIHLQVDPSQSVRLYNAALLLSAPLVGVSANAPYLFGYDLWDETRIPLFEQAVDGLDATLQRVTFGQGYVQESLWELFWENLHTYPVLLPLVMDTDPEQLAHLRLHNGTIWRWNRPLIGFDPDGTPHLRLENRVVPAGPTVVDMIANAAFFFGLTRVLSNQLQAPETLLPFATCRTNFYAAARYGLEAEIRWVNSDQPQSLKTLLLETLLPLAQQGLQDLGVDPSAITTYLAILEGRIRTGQNGSQWQRSFVAKYGHNMQQLVCAYLKQQQSGLPVHQWEI